jgi:acetaldehyde dehydrogenase (acetylating)
VGPGNVPVMLERTADIADAVGKIVDGKSFDFGTVCSSEQAVVAENSLRDRVIAELKARKAFFCDDAQKEALGKLLLTPNWTVNPKCVGQPAPKIARMAGFEVPGDAPILVVELTGVGKQHPLSAEKLSPVLSLYFVKDFSEGLATCESLLRFGGLGHTCVIHSKDDARIREYGFRMPAFRVLVNTSAPQGSTGITTGVFPAMTLGCGAMAGNITSDNIGPQHLINIKRITYAVRKAEEAFEIPSTLPATSSRTVDRNQVVAAVEKYLSSRGVSMAPAAKQPGVAADVVANVVDRFISTRRIAPSLQTLAPATASSSNPSPVSEPAAAIVDFVCENDVRDAMRASRKIYIGPKTIVTPSAREFGEQFGILVLAQR